MHRKMRRSFLPVMGTVAVAVYAFVGWRWMREL